MSGQYDSRVFQKIRGALQAGDLARAEAPLDNTLGRGAEWNFLKGAACYRRGWMDEAPRHYEAAAELEPENSEYRRAAERMRSGPPERKRGFGTPFAGSLCVGLGAAYAACNVCLCRGEGCCGCGACLGCARRVDGMPR